LPIQSFGDRRGLAVAIPVGPDVRAEAEAERPVSDRV
jgi:hypothetical protein